MADDVTIKFGADVEQLVSAFNQISALQNKTTEGFQTQAVAAKANGIEMNGLAGQVSTVVRAENAYAQAFAPIDRAFSTSIKGIIQGTTTLQQAENRAAQSLVLSFVDAAEKRLTSWIGSELAMTASTEVGNATRTAADQAGATAQQATQSAGIFKHAGSAAAAVYDDVAQIPYVGWLLAPPAAAAAFAAVAAFSAEGGWDRVPYDGAVTVLHQDEMVLPASLASPLREVVAGLPSYGLPSALAAERDVGLPAQGAAFAQAAAAPPVSLSFQVTSPDARTFRQMLLDEHGTIADAVKKAARNFHAARA